MLTRAQRQVSIKPLVNLHHIVNDILLFLSHLLDIRLIKILIYFILWLFMHERQMQKTHNFSRIKDI